MSLKRRTREHERTRPDEPEPNDQQNPEWSVSSRARPQRGEEDRSQRYTLFSRSLKLGQNDPKLWWLFFVFVVSPPFSQGKNILQLVHDSSSSSWWLFKHWVLASGKRDLRSSSSSRAREESGSLLFDFWTASAALAFSGKSRRKEKQQNTKFVLTFALNRIEHENAWILTWRKKNFEVFWCCFQWSSFEDLRWTFEELFRSHFSF